MVQKSNGGVLCAAGIGLRAPHYQHIQEQKPNIAWFEIHSENFMMPGGPSRELLRQIREDYPISLHGVSLSLGSADGLDQQHLQLLLELIDDIEPMLISEHISWGRINGKHLHDLLPLPYTDESLEIISQHVIEAQDYLGRQILVENPSSYLCFNDNDYTEWEFITELLKRSGAGLLLDINNVYVSCCNHGWSTQAYLDNIPTELVQEIHLAGHSKSEYEGQAVLIDTHSDVVCDEVWQLFSKFIENHGPRATLIEWDEEIPEFAVLYNEAQKAENILHKATKETSDASAA